jgi:hypothetical protein
VTRKSQQNSITRASDSFCGESTPAPDHFIEGFDSRVVDAVCASDINIPDPSRNGSSAVEAAMTVEVATENYFAGTQKTGLSVVFSLIQCQHFHSKH